MRKNIGLAKDGGIEPLVDEKAVAKLLGLSPRTLQNWRVRGGGPSFIRISGRSIRYRLADVRDWIDVRVRRSTSDDGAGRVFSADQIT